MKRRKEFNFKIIHRLANGQELTQEELFNYEFDLSKPENKKVLDEFLFILSPQQMSKRNYQIKLNENRRRRNEVLKELAKLGV